MRVLKKSELYSIDVKYQLITSDMETKIKSSKDEKEKEIQALKDLLEIKFEVNKKMAVAEARLELADMKNKYVETLAELNSAKLKKAGNNK